jgi:glycine betaine transporter
VVIVLMAIALRRAVREDWAAEQSRERELRRRLRALAERL